MKNHNEYIEHYCIPLGLILLNCCVIHFLFLISVADMRSGWYTPAVGIAGLALIITIMGKMKWGILLASLLYAVLLLYAIFALDAATSY